MHIPLQEVFGSYLVLFKVDQSLHFWWAPNRYQIVLRFCSLPRYNCFPPLVSKWLQGFVRVPLRLRAGPTHPPPLPPHAAWRDTASPASFLRVRMLTHQTSLSACRLLSHSTDSWKASEHIKTAFSGSLGHEQISFTFVLDPEICCPDTPAREGSLARAENAVSLWRPPQLQSCLAQAHASPRGGPYLMAVSCLSVKSWPSMHGSGQFWAAILALKLPMGSGKSTAGPGLPLRFSTS